MGLKPILLGFINIAVAALVNGSAVAQEPTALVHVTGISTATAISAGAGHSCALLDGGTVACWGANADGQLGDGTTKDSAAPVKVRGVTEAVAIAAGFGHTCALLKNGSVTCWGQNLEGQLGNGKKEKWSGPVMTMNVSRAVAISTGVAHSCAVLADGTVWCWGTDSFISGPGPPITISLRSPVPVKIPKISSAVSVANGRNHTCALLKDGRVECWGSNILAQLGARTFGRFSPDPVQVEGVSGAKSISAGMFATCAVTENGEVKCWGGMHAEKPGASGLRGISKATRVALAGNGEDIWILLSDGTVMRGSARPSSSQVLVKGVSDAKDIAAGFAHTCAVLSGGKVAGWGENRYGQLGGGTLQGGARQPVPELLEQTPSGEKSVEGTALTPTVFRDTPVLGAMKLIHTAEIAYTGIFQKGFSADLRSLGPPKRGAASSESAADLIDLELASGRKAGYVFIYNPLAPDQQERFQKFEVTARPIKWQQGMRSFFIDDSGVARATHENRPATAQDEPVKLLIRLQ